MADAGWSWSPTRALTAFDPNARLPARQMAGLPGISNFNTSLASGSGTQKPLPPIASGIQNIPPASTAVGMSSALPGSAASTSAAAKTTTSAPKKRKSDAVDNSHLFPEDVEEIDSDDERLELTTSDTCNQVRRKIRNWIESGAMKVGEFQKAIGVSSKGYGSFMNRTGTWDGEGCDTYIKAHRFFKTRELQGLPIKAAKPKKAKTKEDAKKAEQLFDVDGVTLPGEESGSVPIYDTCDEVRKKIRAFLAKDGVTQAAFVREISKTFPEGTKNVSSANLRYFMGRKGVVDGNINASFYAGYVFFEKLRIKAGKPKTKFREEMEDVHGIGGVNIEHSSNAPVLVHVDSTVYFDKYGKFRSFRRR